MSKRDELRELCQVADVEARQRLRSASSSSLIVGRTRLSTVGDRAFPVAAARIWNIMLKMSTIGRNEHTASLCPGPVSI